MASVLACFPSANAERVQPAVDAYIAKGYDVAVLVDQIAAPKRCAVLAVRRYEGYWSSINALVEAFGHEADVFLATADDIDPVPDLAGPHLANQFLLRFPDGFGLMQPCGDLQGMDESGRPAAARICGSPWFGRGWTERAFGGKGPMPNGTFHFYADEALFEIAQRLEVLYLRPDLVQFHRHWSWGHRPIADYNERNQEHWNEDKAWFDRQKAEGFKTLMESFLRIDERR